MIKSLRILLLTFLILTFLPTNLILKEDLAAWSWAWWRVSCGGGWARPAPRWTSARSSTLSSARRRCWNTGREDKYFIILAAGGVLWFSADIYHITRVSAGAGYNTITPRHGLCSVSSSALRTRRRGADRQKCRLWLQSCRHMGDRSFARKILCKGFLNENEAEVSRRPWFVVKRRKTVYNVRKVNDFWTEYPSLVVNIRDVSRSPMSDHRYPPPLRHVARLEATDPWLQTVQHFLGWRTDYQWSPVLTLMYTSIFDIHKHRHTWTWSGHPSPCLVTKRGSSALTNCCPVVGS